MTRSTEQIIDYFDEYIFGFIFHDIEQCIHAKANYVIALALLSYTEYMGGLITGNLGESDKSKENFNKALEYFKCDDGGNYYTDFQVIYTDKNNESRKADIYKIFRCGLVHEYFVKGDSFVHNEPSYLPKEDKGIGFVDIKGQKRLRFHCNAYFRDFRNAVMKYYKLLVIDKDPNLLNNFNKALDRVDARKISEIDEPHIAPHKTFPKSP